MAECGAPPINKSSDGIWTRVGECPKVDSCDAKDKTKSCQVAFLAGVQKQWSLVCLCTKLPKPAETKDAAKAAYDAAKKKLEAKFPQPATVGTDSLPRLIYEPNSEGCILNIEFQEIGKEKQAHIVAWCTGGCDPKAAPKEVCVLEYQQKLKGRTETSNPLQELTLRCTCLPGKEKPK